MAGFSGFPEEGMRFLKGLKKNNQREWFQPRKEVFEESVKAPMEQMVEALNAKLLGFAPQYITEPKRAVYRIYRDTRFSNDKTPYKTHIAASLTRAGMQKHVSAGFYFSVSPEQIEVAGGVYMPGPEQLRLLRAHIAENHGELEGILNNATLRKLMGGLWGEKFARMPKGFPADHPAGDLLRAKHWVLYDTERMDAKLATTTKLLPEFVKRFQAMTPFVEFLNRPLLTKRAPDPLMVGLR
ncbi:MAG: DUF2461 domain-containing protein [Acidobacteria bacterium]|nr:DUF2461 domain-containing protein [Acidobacteriota bacterium]